METLTTLAQTPSIPPISDWMVWGPLGGFFLFCLYLGWDFYRSELKPRAKQRREHEAEAHRAHLGFVNTTADCLPEMRDTLRIVVTQQDAHGKDIGWIKDHLHRSSRCDPSPGEPANPVARPNP